MSMFAQGYVPDGSVTDAKVAANAAIKASKLESGAGGFFRQLLQKQGIAVQGSWSWITDASQTDYASATGEGAGFFNNSNTTPADLDEYKWSGVFLPAGNYKITLSYIKASDRGILEILFGTTSLGTPIDLYNASTLYNQSFTVTFTLAAAITGDFRIRVNGKNGSSTAYKMGFSRLQLEKTG